MQERISWWCCLDKNQRNLVWLYVTPMLYIALESWNYVLGFYKMYKDAQKKKKKVVDLHLCLYPYQLCNFVSRGINYLILDTPATFLVQAMLFSNAACLSTYKEELAFIPRILKKKKAIFTFKEL